MGAEGLAWRVKDKQPVADLGEGPPPPLLILGEKKDETTERREASWDGKIEPGLFFSLKSGSATLLKYQMYLALLCLLGTL